MTQKTAAIQNLGCSKNQIDGERILALFASRGFKIINDCEHADVIIVNTCSFIREATEEAIDTILEMAALKKSGSRKTLAVCGCFSERYRDKVKKEFPEVDIWAGVDDWHSVISSLIKNPEDGHSTQKEGVDHDTLKPLPVYGDDDPNQQKISPRNEYDYQPDSYTRILTEPLSTQYIKIAEGCSHKCSYCVIPSIRGKFRSRGINDILREAKWLYGQGTRELILVAQDTSFYGRDINTNLTRLLESLLKETAFPWIRMMYLHPQFVDSDLLTLIASEPRLCPYFDIPLQHISDKILAAMNRRPPSKDIYDMLDRIRTAVPNAVIRTSFIAGFPGESAKEFNELKRFIQQTKFDKMGVFPFSPEEGTAANAMRPKPSAATTQKRCEELMAIQQEISRNISESKIGSTIPIIVDRISGNHDFNYEGRTIGDAPEVDGRVFISSGSFEIGQIFTGKIIGASDYDLYA